MCKKDTHVERAAVTAKRLASRVRELLVDPKRQVHNLRVTLGGEWDRQVAAVRHAIEDETKIRP